MLSRFIPLLTLSLVAAVMASSPADALCSFGKCKTTVWQPGAKATYFGGISKPAHLTPYGVTAGHQTSYGVTSGHQTSYGVTAGHQTPYGVTTGHQTAYGVSGGHQTSYGVTSGQQTGFGVMGAGCKQTGFGVVCSDRRLKRDVVAVGRLDNGLPLYRFRYLWSSQVYVGVMAQDVERIMPAAVLRGDDGYLRVDYSRLGLHLRSWREWRAERAPTAL